MLVVDSCAARAFSSGAWIPSVPLVPERSCRGFPSQGSGGSRASGGTQWPRYFLRDMGPPEMFHRAARPTRAPERGPMATGTLGRNAWRGQGMRAHGERPVGSLTSVARGLRRQMLGQQGFGEVCLRAVPSIHTMPIPHARGKATGNCQSP